MFKFKYLLLSRESCKPYFLKHNISLLWNGLYIFLIIRLISLSWFLLIAQIKVIVFFLEKNGPSHVPGWDSNLTPNMVRTVLTTSPPRPEIVLQSMFFALLAIWYYFLHKQKKEVFISFHISVMLQMINLLEKKDLLFSFFNCLRSPCGLPCELECEPPNWANHSGAYT